MVNFIAFNFIIYALSSGIDYIAFNWFGVVSWTKEYFYYLFFINLPIATLLTYYIMRKLKENDFL